MSKSIEEKTLQIICEQLGADEQAVTPETNLVMDLGADSLDVVELVMAFESEFNIEIPYDKCNEFKTIGSVIDYINSQKDEIK